MSSLAIGIVVLLAVAATAGWLLGRRSAASASARGPITADTTGVLHRTAAVEPARTLPAARASELPQVPHELPPELAAFRWLEADDLPAERRKAYVSVFRDVPRPPKLLHHLLSPDFVNTASSAQLADLISAEPLIAAKVLAAVNSPMYGLARPVTGIGQAVTFLGLDTVRSVCMQYILISSFRAEERERKRLLEPTWLASALASELTQRLSAQLGLDDRGSLVSAVVLSFLGRLATTASTPAPILASIPARGLLERTAAEQSRLGLGASEIGRLLMREWGLPARVVEDAANVDRVLVTPASAAPAPQGARLALCYLCARLGERLASGELSDLEAFDLETQTGAELHHLLSYLDDGVLSRLPWLLREPELVETVRRMQTPLGR